MELLVGGITMSAVYNLSDLYVGDVLIFKKGKLSLFPHKVIVGVEEDLVGAFLRSKEERHQNIWFYTYYLFPHFSSFGQVLGLYEKEKISQQEGCYLTHLEPLYPYFNQQAPDFAHQALLQSSFITDNELFSCYVKLRELERNSDSIVFENQPIIDYLHYKLGFLEGRAVRLSEKSGVHLQFSDTEFSFDNFYQLGFHASYHYYQYHPEELTKRTENNEEFIRQKFEESVMLHNMIYHSEKPMLKVKIDERK